MNKVVCGDCLEVFKGFKVANLKFDLIIADPPFNKGKDYGDLVNDSKDLNEYYTWCQSWVQKGFELLKETGSFYVYCSSQHLGWFQMIMAKYGVWQNTIVWGYTNPTPDKKRFPKTWSAFLFFTKKKIGYYFNPYAVFVEGFKTNLFSKVKKTRLSDLWLGISKLTGGYLAQKEVILKPGTKKRECIYQLPEMLLENILLSSSKPGGLVLDLFSHSGTTSAVAKKNNRESIAVEINKDYCKIIKMRLQSIWLTFDFEGMGNEVIK